MRIYKKENPSRNPVFKYKKESENRVRKLEFSKQRIVQHERWIQKEVQVGTWNFKNENIQEGKSESEPGF